MIKTPITIYTHSTFGVRREEGWYHAHGTMPYAQYTAVPYVDYTPVGKRKPLRMRMNGFQPFLLVLHGHGHPAPEDSFNPSETSASGLIVSSTRYSSCDPRWETDFNTKINPLLDRCPELVLFDARWTKATTPEEKDLTDELTPDPDRTASDDQSSRPVLHAPLPGE